MGDIRANLPLPRAKPWNHGLEIAAAARRRDCPDFEGKACVCGGHRDDIAGECLKKAWFQDCSH